MIKREWPQHWPDMLKEMEVLTSQGVSNINHAEKVDSLPASQFHEYLDSQIHD